MRTIYQPRIESLSRALADEVMNCLDLSPETTISVTIHKTHVEAVVHARVDENNRALGFEKQTRIAQIEEY